MKKGIEMGELGRKGLVWLILSAWTPSVFGAFNSGDVGTSGAQFLKIPTSVRATAMGSAFTAVADDASALDYNPAGLGGLARSQASFMHHEYLGLFKQEVLAYAHRISPESGFGGGLNLLTQEGIEKVDNTGAATGESFAPMDMSLKLGYGRKMEGFSVGAGGMYVRQSIDGDSASAFAVNLGVLADGPAEGLKLGAALTSLGTKIGFREKAALPAALRLGAAYRGEGGTLYSVEGGFPSDNEPEGRVGLERGFKLVGVEAAVRGGYESGRVGGLGMLAGLSMGFGVRMKSLGMDFAFVPFGDLGESYRMGLSWSFGGEEGEDEAYSYQPKKDSYVRHYWTGVDVVEARD